ncbi:serine protease DegQ [Methylomarinovum tepidoasis]|uniref:Serine protease DegQ n=1 Tax=Methylomarinovum tepidoasis TaxID=2840183 RepID=A0AAU9CAK0_9GAMM|nr:DegQ family serine endoprotease [Methylomarinovum sp. IN45]BCX89505.1 serine protease DegQ [Methylomarinovum sp. IN45]
MMNRLLATLAFGVFFSLSAQGGIIPWLKGGETGTETQVPTELRRDNLPSLAPMLEHVLPAVVNIAASGKVVVENPLLQDPFFRYFFRGMPPQMERKTQSVGSGVIVDAGKGYVITNHHVVKNADTIYVILKDRRRIKAKLVGSDPETDIAVLKVKPERLQALPLGDSDALRVGDFVVAIGNPFGLGQTVTSGIVSALGRTGLGIEGYENFIQTDASINPGNSGGALVDLRGRLVGINTAIVAPSGGNVGIGFAIPINMAHQVMQQIIKYGEVKRGMLGVQVQDLTPELAEAMGIDVKEGALISGVTKGSAAEKAGLKPGDVIIGFDGKRVKNSAQLRNLVGLKRVGDKAEVELIRDGKRMTMTVTIGKPIAEGGPVTDIPMLEGAYLSDIPPDHPLYGEIQGVLVAGVEMGSPAWQAGLRKGDIILSVNRKRVKSVAEFLQAARQSPARLLLRIQRGNFSLFLVLER